MSDSYAVSFDVVTLALCSSCVAGPNLILLSTDSFSSLAFDKVNEMIVHVKVIIAVMWCVTVWMTAHTGWVSFGR